jgi:alpha-tubulin suppressor-like RCC1 family protein
LAGGATCWGFNQEGALGDGTFTHRSSPTAVAGLASGVRRTVAGSSHSCAMLTNGGVRCWGVNQYGALGDGSLVNSATPVVATGVGNVTAIAVGSQHTCAALAGGGASCWGHNGYTQIGDGTAINRTTAVSVSGLAAAARRTVSAGGLHSCATTATGGVECWGSNSAGQLGRGSSDTNSFGPAPVPGLSNVSEVSAGAYHTCALIADGTVRCWGDNDYGALGDNSTTQRLSPVTVSGLTNAIDISAGAYHTCAVLSDGTARCWGYNASGMIGDGTTVNRLVPTPVTSLTSAVNIAGGYHHTCATRTSGVVFCWGSNNSGQLGDGSFDQALTPTVTIGFSNARSVEAGDHHACAVLTDGTLRCWGFNAAGQLGDASMINRDIPVTVTGVSGAVGVDLAYTHTCAVLVSGAARCWGSNANGALGNGTTISSTTAVTVASISDVTSVSASSSHSCAMRLAGVNCWGSNAWNQVGVCTTGNHLLPVAPIYTDLDCDTIANAGDNCAEAHNPGQENNDRNFTDLSPPKAFDDATLPMSDLIGDACDTDDDNDGRSDANEISGQNCPGVGIFTTNPVLSDTDGDHALDGVECNLTSNPFVAADEPTIAECGGTSDADGDGLPAFRETCYYGTDPANANSDGDGCGDRREAMSVNADQSVNVIDLSQVAGEFGTYSAGASIVRYTFDVTKDGSINVIDLSQVAAAIGPCP